MVLLTGATGFLGSGLLKRLLHAGWEVCCIKRKTSDCLRVKEIMGQCRWYDLGQGVIEKIFQGHPIQMVIHCATDYGKEPGGYFDVYRANVAFPLELLEYALKYGCQYFINTDTFFVKAIKCPQAAGKELYRSAYTRTKYLLTYIVKGQIAGWDIAFLNMQLEHLYGEDDGEQKFASFILRQLRENRSQVELTEGTQIRDWVYMEDVLDAYMAVIQCRSQFGIRRFHPFEVGTGEGHSLKEFVQAVKEQTGSSTRLLFGKRQMQQGELAYSCADVRAMEGLGWKARYKMADGIREMIKKDNQWKGLGYESSDSGRRVWHTDR